MNEQPHKVFNFANLCKENTQKIFEEDSSKNVNDFTNAGQKFKLFF